MESLEEDFIPDFTHLTTAGEVSNRGSLIKQVGDLTYISVNDRLNIWNIRFSEIVQTVHGLKKKITSFDYRDSLLAIGYENGIVQIHSDKITSFRPHSKRVVRIIKRKDYIISASSDGSIILYDLVGEEVKIYYEGNTNCIDDILIDSQSIIAICADNALRVWDIQDKNIKSIHMFEKSIKSIVIEQGSSVIFFRDGECIFYDFEERISQHFNKFKKLRNVKREGKRTFVQCKNKLHVYEVSKGERVVLKNLETIGTSDRYVDFDVVPGWGFVFITTDNCWEAIKEGKIYSFGYHRNEILNFEIYDGNLVTFSKENIIFWTLENEKVERIGNIQIRNGENMCLWNGNVVVSGSSGFACYSILSYDLVKEENIGAISFISTNGNELAVGKDKLVIFYDKGYKVARTLEVEEPISAIGMSESSTLFCVGLLNCKVYLYDLESLTLKIVLYGHSLPVRSMMLSPDSSELLTCGADKVLKMWGTQFGECRKTFIGDAKNVEYLNKSLFMFSSDKIQYFKRYDRLKEFKRYSSSLVKVKDDLMVSCGKLNIDVYKMDKYEFQEDESSSEEEVLNATKIVNYKKYDEFLLGLEKLAEDFSDDNIRLFFNILAEIDLCELDKFLYLLSSLDVSQIMNVLDVCSNWNIILVAKIFISLTKLHKEICISHVKFKCILKTVTEKVIDIRDQIGMNEGKLLTERNLENGDIEEEFISTV